MRLGTTKTIHPGAVLLEVYMKPAWPPLTVAVLSRMMHVPRRHLRELLRGHRGISASAAARLGVVCRTTPEYWMSLQRTYDEQARRQRIEPRQRLRKAAA